MSADDISYNYPAMEAAAQNMSSIHNRINGECENLIDKGTQAYGASSGSYADEYMAKVKELHTLLSEFNGDFGSRIKQYELEYEAMRGLDVNLGATF